MVGNRPLYEVGGICETCETTARLVVWQPRIAATLAEQVRHAVASVTDLGQLLDVAVPLLEELETGHYRVFLIDLPVERVTEPSGSWFVRRQEDRDADLYPEGADWPGVEHFQVPQRIPGPMATYGVLLPSQPLTGLDASTVDRYRQPITHGARPAALVLGWIEDIWVRTAVEERFLVGAVLDGHHKLAAYAAAGVPARIVFFARAEDNFHDDYDWGERLEAVLAPFG